MDKILELDDNMRLYDPEAREKFNDLPEDKKAKSLSAKTFILYPFELFYNQKKTFEEKEHETMYLIEEHLKKYKKCFVATSFGMDSIVLMDLVIKASKNVGCDIPDMFLNDTLNIFKEEKQYWTEIIELFGIQDQFRLFKPPKDKSGKQQTVWTIAEKYGHLPTFRSTARAKGHKTGSHGKTPECCNILKKASMKKYLKQVKKETGVEYDCHFIGTRAEESRMRAISVLQRCRSYVITTLFPYHIRAVTPISFWTKSDIYQYYAKYNLPKNPAYKAHNMERMGCASCPAHKNWEIRLAKDPTNEGLGMLKQNFKILKQTEPDRLIESIKTLKKYLDKKKSHEEISEVSRSKVLDIISQFDMPIEKAQ